MLAFSFFCLLSTKFVDNGTSFKACDKIVLLHGYFMIYQKGLTMELRRINWPIFTFISVYHVLLMIGLPLYLYYYSITWSLVGIALLLFFATGMSITGGYHRLYSHRTYKANKIVEFALLFFGTMAGQGSALRWSHDHRIHHAHIDTDKDPYSIKKGFL